MPSAFSPSPGTGASLCGSTGVIRTDTAVAPSIGATAPRPRLTTNWPSGVAMPAAADPASLIPIVVDRAVGFTFSGATTTGGST